jgi:hypothetical protein
MLQLLAHHTQTRGPPLVRKRNPVPFSQPPKPSPTPKLLDECQLFFKIISHLKIVVFPSHLSIQYLLRAYLLLPLSCKFCFIVRPSVITLLFSATASCVVCIGGGQQHQQPPQPGPGGHLCQPQLQPAGIGIHLFHTHSLFFV